MLRPAVVLLAIAAAWLVAPPTAGRPDAQAARATAADKPIVEQSLAGENSCGPCALYHALAWGDARLAAVAKKLGREPADAVARLIELYGGKPSEAYGGKRARYEAASGITWIDLGRVVDDLLADHRLPAAAAGYLDRRRDEPPFAHARRVHALLRDSLRAGFPPLLSIRSFCARRDPEKGGRDEDAFEWQGLGGHWVAVVEVQAELAKDEEGFRIGFVDSESGKLLFGYAFAEEARNFTAARGDAEKWEWVTNRPFLLLAAPRPTMSVQDAPWHSRAIVTLNFAITRPK